MFSTLVFPLPDTFFITFSIQCTTNNYFRCLIYSRNLNVKNCQNFPPTDRPTDQPTDKPTPWSSVPELKNLRISSYFRYQLYWLRRFFWYPYYHVLFISWKMPCILKCQKLSFLEIFCHFMTHCIFHKLTKHGNIGIKWTVSFSRNGI